MIELNPEALHTRFDSLESHTFSLPRRYTLTHSDRTGEMFLTVGKDFCQEQISGLYTRLMRDEVLAEWRDWDGGLELHVLCHVSGGVVFGSARMRLGIFKQQMRLVLEALRFGDRDIYAVRPELDAVRVKVHFCSKDPVIDQVQDYGPVSGFV
jgi:magnesium dechelatase